jgi:hypothetical protein
MKNPKRIAPTPIIDNLAVIGDRRQREAQARSVTRFFTGEPLSGAGQDYVSTLQFLVSYGGSTATFNAYRRELERLLQWSWHIPLTLIQIDPLVLTQIDPPNFVLTTFNPIDKPVEMDSTKGRILYSKERVGARQQQPE